MVCPPKEMLCKATKSQHQNLLPLKSNPTGLSFWKSPLWIHLSFYFSDCKDEGVLFLIPTETVEASWFMTHGGWSRVTVRGKPFPAQRSIIPAKVDPCHIFVHFLPLLLFELCQIITVPPWPCSFHQATHTAGLPVLLQPFLLFLAWVFPCAKSPLGVANLNEDKQFWNQPWSLKATSSKLTHMREQINLKLVDSLSLIYHHSKLPVC